MEGRLNPEEQRRRYCRLKLTCPKCGGTGLIRWDRLDSLLHCHGCTTWFRMVGNGRLVSTAAPPISIRISSRTGLGQWQDRQVPLATGSTGLRHRHPLARGKALQGLALGGLIASLVLGLGILRRSPSASAIELPHSLEERARLLTEAWLDGDVAGMVRLTDVAQDRALRRWIRETPPPASASHPDPQDEGMTVLIGQQEDQTAEVLVRITAASVTMREDPGVELRQRWLSRDGDWYFAPAPARVRGGRGKPSSVRSSGRRPWTRRPALPSKRAGTVRTKAFPS